jgi:sugar/nucleoside kinase (ribokinase family)
MDVTGIGNAIVDVIAQTDDAFVARRELVKGSMNLVDGAQAEALYGEMAPAIESSGGSAGNTMAGFASLGGRGAYIGKVRDDQLGQVFEHDIRAIGVAFDTPHATEGPPTARCLIMVTPDAQRTMCTYLGACVNLGPDDVDEDRIANSKVTYLEGYLFDPPAAKRAFIRAAEVAHAHGRQVSLTLSDVFCVDRHRDAFLELVEHHVDILFANEAELMSLYETNDFEEAMRQLNGHCRTAAVTRSEKGSVVLEGDETHFVSIARYGDVVDTTGAGDLYAAGFLFGVTHGLGAARSGELGALCAAEVISHVGARPEVSLRKLARDRLNLDL